MTTDALAGTRRTALYERHLALGATLTDFAGWQMPLRYSSEAAEHRAVRSAAGLFDLSHMGQIDVSGPDAAAALDYALVGHISAVRVGRARYTMVCAPDGGVIDDLVVYRLAEDHCLVIANAANAQSVLDALAERLSGYAATASLRTGAALIAVQGPAAASIVGRVCSRGQVSDLAYYASTDAVIDGRAVLLARTGYTGEDGFEVFCSGADADALWQLLTSVGAPAGLVPAGLSCRDTLRLEAGMPLYGNELSRATTPYEAGLGRVVRLDKPTDFVGREALAARRSQISRTLVGLRGLTRRVPRHGYAVLDASGAVIGQVIGQVTSGAPSPTLGYPIAMAYVDSAHARPGTEVGIDIRGTAEAAQIVELPFYKRA